MQKMNVVSSSTGPQDGAADQIRLTAPDLTSSIAGFRLITKRWMSTWRKLQNDLQRVLQDLLYSSVNWK